jgi:hypothetical protein
MAEAREIFTAQFVQVFEYPFFLRRDSCVTSFDRQPCIERADH